jgi:hypothetical protein
LIGVKVPGEQFLDAIDGMIRDVRKHMTKVGLWIKSIELGRTNQAVDRGGTLSAGCPVLRVVG